MEKVERRTKGVDDEIIVGRVAWIRVAGSKLGGRDNEGRRERDGHIVRGGADVGVTMRRVRMRSRGARARAAMALAATATARDVNGLGLSIMSSPPMPLAEAPISPGSGTLSNADNKLRVQLSVVLRRKL